MSSRSKSRNAKNEVKLQHEITRVLDRNDYEKLKKDPTKVQEKTH